MASVKVRMYRHGLGDCFLLSLQRGDATSNVMIDCGVLTGTVDAIPRVKAVVQNVREQLPGGVLDVLVVTHEHWDHVSGFLQAKDEFENLPIRNVWLAWTEDDQHELAKSLREQRAAARRAIEHAENRMRASPALATSAAARVVQNLRLFEGVTPGAGLLGAAGRATTSDAMKWAREHPSAKVEFLRPAQSPIDVPGVTGFRAYVLGPPENLKLLRKDRPSQRAPEVYQLGERMNVGLVKALVQAAEGAPATSPFDGSFLVAPEQAKANAFFRSRYFRDDTWRQIEDDWLGSAEGLALQLDSDTNNTSLALAIEDTLTGRVLLFPGDAQVGNWLSWHLHTWTVNEPGGPAREVRVADLLARTVLYKVGHHGSHNATLREQGLELMTHPDLVALIPVDEAKADSLEWDMPFDPLYTRLATRTRGRVLRSDQGMPPRPENVADRVWNDFQARVTVNEKYVDYRLDLT